MAKAKQNKRNQKLASQVLMGFQAMGTLPPALPVGM